jgi:mannose-6-phosphate isomerase
MVIALTPFRALYGIRPVKELVSLLEQVEPLRRLVQVSAIKNLKAIVARNELENPSAQAKAIIEILRSLLNANSEMVKLEATRLLVVARDSLVKGIENVLSSTVAGLIVELYKQYPGDIGLFIALLMNYVSLNPGEAIFVSPGELHAYISGGKNSYFISIEVERLFQSIPSLTCSRCHRMHGSISQYCSSWTYAQNQRHRGLATNRQL